MIYFKKYTFVLTLGEQIKKYETFKKSTKSPINYLNYLIDKVDSQQNHEVSWHDTFPSTCHSSKLVKTLPVNLTSSTIVFFKCMPMLFAAPYETMSISRWMDKQNVVYTYSKTTVKKGVNIGDTCHATT